MDWLEFAPLSVPLPRRLQTTSIVLWLLLLPLSAFLFLLTFYSKVLIPFSLAYLVFVFYDPSPEMGGR
jgi:2-acylglycerol O-acyltransferase 2